MAGPLKYLNVELRLATKDFNNGIKEAQREAKEFEKTIKPMKDVLHSVGVAATTAGAAIVGSFLAMTKASADYGDALNDASKRTGATVEDLAKLKYAAEQSGASFEDVTNGMRFLAVNANKAAEGAKTQSAAFAELGIKVTDAAGKVRPMNDLVLDIADRFKTMQDGAEKSALAVELFGRGGTALIPTLNEGSAGLKAMGNEAERLGLVISKDAAEASDKFNDAMADLKGSVMGLSNAVADSLLPMVTDVVDFMTEGIIKVRNFAKEHEFLTKVIFGVGVALVGAGGLALGANVAISALTSLNTVVKVVTLSIGAMQAAISAGSLLTAVRSYGDLNAAISVIGGTSIAAKAGLIGLAAAAGYGIGQFANWILKTYELEDSFDNLLQTTLKVIGPVGTLINKIAGVSTAQAGLKEATDGLAKANARLVDDLKKHNIVVDEARLGDSAYKASLSKLLTEELKRTGQLKVSAQAHKDNKSEVDKAADAANRAATAAQKAAAAESKRADAIRTVNSALSDQYNEMMRVERASRDDLDRILDYRSDAWLKAEQERVRATRDALDKILAIEGGLDRERQEFNRDTQERMKNERDTALANSERVAKDILDKMKQQKSAAQEFSQAWSTAIGNIASRFSGTIADMIVDWDFGWKGMLDILKDTAKSMLSAFISGFITPLLSQTAGLGAQLGKLVFGGGGGVGGVIGGVLGGGGGGGGILGNLGGGVLSGLLGGGGAIGTAVLAPAGTAALSAQLGSLAALVPGMGASAGVAGGAAAAGSGSLFGGLGSTIAGLASNPFTIIGAGALAGGLLVPKLFGRTRKLANAFTSTTQHQFGQALAEIVDPITASDESGTLTLDKALNAQAEIMALWQEFQSIAEPFASKGSKQRKVVNQAYEHLWPILSDINADMENRIGRLSGVEASAASDSGDDSLAGSFTMNQTVNVNVTFNVDDMGDISAMDVRDKVIPEITTVLETGIRGVREKWTQIFRDSMQGVASTSVG